MLAVSLETAMIASFAGSTNQAGLSMGVFFSFCFISFYGGGIDVVGYVYCSKSMLQFGGTSLTWLQARSFQPIFARRVLHGKHIDLRPSSMIHERT